MKKGYRLRTALVSVAAALCTLLVIGGLGYLFRGRILLPAGPDPTTQPSRSGDDSHAPPERPAPRPDDGSGTPVESKASSDQPEPSFSTSSEPVPTLDPTPDPTPTPMPAPQPTAPVERPAPDPNVPYQSLYPDLYAAPGTQSEDLPGVIYLTIDDGPSKYTATVLDILKAHGVKATFFVVTGAGELPEWKAELMRRIVAEGHTLGLHSSTHDFKTIYASVEAYLDDFSTASDLIYGATGVRPWVFRFPGGTKNSYNKWTYPDIVAEMNRRGFVHYDWNCSAEDASTKATSDSIWRNMLANISNDRRNVLLMHDTKPLTVDLLDSFLTRMEQEGHTFAPLTPDVKPVNWY